MLRALYLLVNQAERLKIHSGPENLKPGQSLVFSLPLMVKEQSLRISQEQEMTEALEAKADVCNTEINAVGNDWSFLQALYPGLLS